MSQLAPLLLDATLETLYMVGVAGLVSLVLGVPLGVALIATGPGGLRPQPVVNRVLGTAVNIGRSLPFIILLIALIPFTRLVVGTSLGSTAAIVPLAVGAIPFYARLIEASLAEVHPSKLEAAVAMGSTHRQIVSKVLLPEAMPSLVAGLTVTLIALVSYSAMAGVVGGGGLGDVAIRFGYQRFRGDVMLATVVLLVVIVQLLQVVGDLLVRRLRRH
ncbi:methionine ABC transporter permease [Egicoccus halophilus]|uniref:Metal ABC transporter permease n=1 Tax=Egicoccus halophilus TaxID=1670830 RepID=A0A8J3A9D9_9ACTN|nr:methionine ABC transporter permease [Egicoccus halophilus]GGI05086.1 metal ABC transporter permease [Egicoccus halophilus]